MKMPPLEKMVSVMQPLTMTERKHLSRYIRLTELGECPDEPCDQDVALDALDKLTPEQAELFRRYVIALYGE
jgi:hypothetical protein